MSNRDVAKEENRGDGWKTVPARPETPARRDLAQSQWVSSEDNEGDDAAPHKLLGEGPASGHSIQDATSASHKFSCSPQQSTAFMSAVTEAV